MTRFTRMASLLVALCLLTSAATACAECAWVLWAETRESGYGTVSASDTREVCERALGKQIARWKTGTNWG
jgi:hypothetical protein